MGLQPIYTIYDKVPEEIADQFVDYINGNLVLEVLPELEKGLAEPQGLVLEGLNFDSDTLCFGGKKLRFVLMPERKRLDFMPIQNKINHPYLARLTKTTNQIQEIIAGSTRDADYSLWSGLPVTLDEIAVELQGDIVYATMGVIKEKLSVYFSMDNLEILGRGLGQKLFPQLLEISLLLDEIFVLPQTVLGNFFPEELMGGDTCIIEIYSESVMNHNADIATILRHEFFHFFHYVCVGKCRGSWLRYNTSFQKNLAVIESLARYYDQTPECVGNFPNNPYFGANYLKLFDLLRPENTGVYYRENSHLKRLELNPGDATRMNTHYDKIFEQGEMGEAFCRLFTLSLEDMGKAYVFLNELRQICLNQVEIQ